MTCDPRPVYLLQPLFRPELEDVNAADLYLRGAYLSAFTEREIFIKPFGFLVSDTFFNAFSLYFWHEKTTLDEVTLTIDITGGRGEVIVFHRTTSGLTRLATSTFDRDTPGSISFPFSVRALKKGMVFWEIRALTQVTATDARYETRQAPERDVALGAVITTFKREAAATSTMARFAGSRLAAEGHRLIVIDNGQSLPPQNLPGVEIIPNANLGGAGGFSRGLMELRRRGGFTHCLFMDDDASTHMECIAKAVAYLAYATSEQLAVAGTAFHVEQPWLQFEAGARVNTYGIEGVKGGRDMRDAFMLLINEDDEPVHYGGWWFFAFHMSAAKEYAFPFFVRGDDITFGLRHEFDTIAPTGIASWQPSFDEKISPSVEYLAHRAEFLIALLGSARSGTALSDVLDASFASIWSEATCFRYGMAAARCQAMEDVLAGPDFWRANPSALPRLMELKKKYPEEYARPMSRKDVFGLEFYPRDTRERRGRRRLRRFSRDGYFLPQSWAKRHFEIHGLATHPNAALGAKAITYYSPDSGVGFTVQRAHARYFEIWRRIRAIRAKALRDGAALTAAYAAAMPELTSEAFWVKTLKLEESADGAAAPAGTPHTAGA